MGTDSLFASLQAQAGLLSICSKVKDIKCEMEVRNGALMVWI